MMFIRRGDIISCCYVIECHRYYDKVGTILTANLIKKLIEIQYAVYSDIIALVKIDTRSNVHADL